jgi:radical SAM superfamily enzyme YgiQ (UPF0313 family)
VGTSVYFSDLTHTGQTVCANTFPLGAAMVAAYAKQQLGREIEIEVFKYPEELSKYLERSVPGIAAFSSYSWNNNLGHEYARRIKERSPETVVVFGGENFPAYGGIRTEWAEKIQVEYFQKYPAIDFFIFSESEVAFVELFKNLKQFHFDVAAFKSERFKSPNVYYLVDNELVSGPIMPLLADMDLIPSTFANGLSDKFFDGQLTPMIESARGCPYSCTFCTDGHLYSNKTRRFSQERIKEELGYIAQRATVNELIITDLNFGMFQEDVDTARFLAGLQDQYDFPRYLVQASAKNNKERIIEISHIMRGALAPGASVQSTDPGVLKAIKRKNLTLNELIEVSKTRDEDDGSSLSEIIMCLPEDSKERHFKSVFDMIDAGVTLLRNHQFMLLLGTEGEGLPSRERYQMQTAFRVQPRCFGIYKLWGEEFSSVEIEEICVANSTMTYQDYQECRDLNLSVEIFLNDAIFYDLFRLLDQYQVPRSLFIRKAHDRAINGDGPVSRLYSDYRDEEKKNVWKDYEGLAEFTSNPGVIRQYVNSEFGSNEIYKYRVLAMFDHMEELHQIVYSVANELLGNSLDSDPIMSLYRDELQEFSLLRKTNFLSYESSHSRIFHFDFEALSLENFSLDPANVHVPEGLEIEIFHTGRQKQMIREWIQQHGTHVDGLGRLISRAQVSALYRQAKLKDANHSFSPKWLAEQIEVDSLSDGKLK